MPKPSEKRVQIKDTHEPSYYDETQFHCHLQETPVDNGSWYQRLMDDEHGARTGACASEFIRPRRRYE